MEALERLIASSQASVDTIVPEKKDLKSRCRRIAESDLRTRSFTSLCNEQSCTIRFGKSVRSSESVFAQNELSMKSFARTGQLSLPGSRSWRQARSTSLPRPVSYLRSHMRQSAQIPTPTAKGFECSALEDRHSVLRYQRTHCLASHGFVSTLTVAPAHCRCKHHMLRHQDF
eukprot:666793-Amphidinium_carterae.2